MIQCLKSLLGKIQTTISTILTWITFILIPVSLLFATYYVFEDFSFQRVIAGLSMTVVCVYVNKAL